MARFDRCLDLETIVGEAKVSHLAKFVSWPSLAEDCIGKGREEGEILEHDSFVGIGQVALAAVESEIGGQVRSFSKDLIHTQKDVSGVFILRGIDKGAGIRQDRDQSYGPSQGRDRVFVVERDRFRDGQI
ncbi:MAG: hypothetical protein M2R45_02465 [Verrucomicrobia subdivision 3 bacterium]|nr:hypothetical protein [Limisphaerales bacterium]MCS1413253.1 hypothetical protein [Limisphaerales bacterium]